MRKEIDILKGIAILAVVFLHFNGFWFSQTKDFVSSLFFDQLVRFSVPLFIALSGYLLAGKYLSRSLSLIDFYLRRVTKLLPLYLLWSVIISLALSQPITIDSLLWGRADYQLYFVPVIFQFYLLFPLLFFLAKRQRYLLLAIGLIIQLIAFRLLGNLPDQEQYRNASIWIYYFILGIFFAFGKPKIPDFIFLIITLLGFVWMFNNALDAWQHGVNLIVVTLTSRPQVIAYSTGVIGLAIVYGEKLRRLPLVVIGKYSYLIYLCHTLFLRLIFTYLVPQISQGDTVRILILGVSGVILSLSPGILKKLPVTRYNCESAGRRTWQSHIIG
ncbi:acyltransferase [Patescibacteria group bacterium]|nr:acyltransferase [Patescibacteria group bacterium]